MLVPSGMFPAGAIGSHGIYGRLKNVFVFKLFQVVMQKKENKREDRISLVEYRE